jgi:hypothetical protein
MGGIFSKITDQTQNVTFLEDTLANIGYILIIYKINGPKQHFVD